MAFERVDDLTSCTHVDLLGWVSYPYSDTSKFFPYFQYVCEQDGFTFIDRDLFPDKGEILAISTSELNAQDIRNRFGNFVVAKINVSSPAEDFNYRRGGTKYRLRFNQHVANPDLSMTRLSEHPVLANKLIQIVTAGDHFSFLKPLDEALPLESGTCIAETRYILVEDGDSLFGPFDYSIMQNDRILLTAVEQYDYRVIRTSIHDFDDVLEVYDVEDTRKAMFVVKPDFDDMFDMISDEEKLDWVPESVLIDTVIRAINSTDQMEDLNRNHIRLVKQAVRSYSADFLPFNLDAARREKIDQILSDVESWIELPDEICSTFVRSVPDEQLERVLLRDEIYSQIEDRVMRAAGVEKRIDERRQELEGKLNGLKEEIKTAHEDILALEQEKASIEKGIEEFQKKVIEDKKREYEELEEKCSKKRADFDDLQTSYTALLRMNDELKSKTDEIIKSLDDEVAMSSKILESELLNKVIETVTGIDLDRNIPKKQFRCSALREDDREINPSEVVDCLFEAIVSESGRGYSRNDVINYMICMMQGYVTTFAGLPGTGKTSLCGLLAGALGLVGDEDGTRFSEISVERGWTSYKDYIGYFNPLSKTYEKANAEVYDAMEWLNAEGEDDSIPYVFLLDEANLSPIEHYWSPFLKACDGFETKGAIVPLGGEVVWRLPRHVRFLATVNFDHTTETLSPRFLDRSWVVTLEPDYSEIGDIAGGVSTRQPRKAFSYETLMRVFGEPLAEIDSATSVLLSDILRICRDNRYPVSPRSQLMIRRYLSTANALMARNTRDGFNAPLDYAVHQKILPSLNGTDGNLKRLLEELRDVTPQLKRTHQRLARMIEAGEENGFYQFFV